MPEKNDNFIKALSEDLTPVKPVRSSRSKALIWAAIALFAIGLMVYTHGIRHDISAKLGETFFISQTLGLIAFAVLTALAGFKLSVPDEANKHRIWVALIYGALFFWVITLAQSLLHLGFFDVLHHMGETMYMGGKCAASVISGAIGAATVMLIMLRRSFALRPFTTSMGIGIAAGTIAFVGGMYFCSIDGGMHIAAWHMLPVLIVAAALAIAGQFFLKK